MGRKKHKNKTNNINSNESHNEDLKLEENIVESSEIVDTTTLKSEVENNDVDLIIKETEQDEQVLESKEVNIEQDIEVKEEINIEPKEQEEQNIKEDEIYIEVQKENTKTDNVESQEIKEDDVKQKFKFFTLEKLNRGILVGYAIILGFIGVYSFIFERPQNVETTVSTEEVQPVKRMTQNYFVDIDLDTIEEQKILWNAAFRGAVDNYLGKNTYIKLTQTTSSINNKGNLANVVLNTNLTVDFDTQRLYCITDLSDNLGNKHSEYFYDKHDNLYLTKTEEDGWVKSKKVAVNVNFDLNNYEDSARFYKFLLKDFGIKNNIEGNIIEKHIYFNYTRPAIAKDLTNINYDNLDNTTIQLVFKKVSETEIQPLSMIKQVDFESNGNTYSSKLVILFDTVSTKRLMIPIYKDYFEETVSNNNIED